MLRAGAGDDCRASARSHASGCWRGCAARCTTRHGARRWLSSRRRRPRSPRSSATPRLGRWQPPRAAGRSGDRSTWSNAWPTRPRLLTLAREAGDSELACRATHGLSSTCSSTATQTRSMPRSRRSQRGRSSCASRCTCGRPRSGARCGRCSRASSSRPTGLRPRRWPPGRPGRRCSRSVLRDPAARDPARAGTDGRARAARLEMVGYNPGRPAWRACCRDAAVGIRPHRGGAGGIFGYSENDFADIQRDGDWMIAITLLADCAVELGDERACGDSSMSCWRPIATATS